MKKIKKIISLLLAIAALTVLFSGCQTGEDTVKEDPNGEKELGTIKFAIMPGTVRNAVTLLADHLGYFEDEGLNVEFVESSDATAALTSISLDKGEMDIWGTGILPQLTFINNGSDLVVFSGTAAEGGAIISRPEDVEYYKDFNNYEGITIATTRGDTTLPITWRYFQEIGIDVSKLNILEVDTAVTVAEAVSKGEAQVGFLNVWFANSYKDSVSIVYEVGSLVPNYVCCRQVVSRKTLNEKRDELIAFTKANIRGLEYYQDEANHDAIIQYLVEYSGQTAEYIQEYLFDSRTVLTVDPNKQGVLDYYNTLVEMGKFTNDVDMAEHIDDEIYTEALAQLIQEYPDDAFFASLAQ